MCIALHKLKKYSASSTCVFFRVNVTIGCQRIWKQSSFCVLSDSFRHKQLSQGTGGIFKLAPSNNNNHPHTSASEGESNLFASDIRKLSSLCHPFSLHLIFFRRSLCCVLLTSGSLGEHRGYKWLPPSQRLVYLEGYSTLHGRATFFPHIFEVV